MYFKCYTNVSVLYNFCMAKTRKTHSQHVAQQHINTFYFWFNYFPQLICKEFANEMQPFLKL